METVDQKQMDSSKVDLREENQGDISPQEMLLRLLDGWWVIFVMLLLGALVGWLSHFALPPLYEARAGITIALDFDVTDPLDEVVSDQILFAAGETMRSYEVLGQVVEKAVDQGLVVSQAELKQMMFFETRQPVWYLRLRHSDPAVAYLVAEIWGAAAYEYLRTLHGHALQAMVLRQRLEVLGNCVPGSEAEEVEGQPSIDCRFADWGSLDAEIDKIRGQLEAEILASRGVNPALLHGYTHPPVFPEQPVSFQKGVMIFAGALIGFFLGIALVETRSGWRMVGRIRRRLRISTGKSKDEDVR